MLLRQGTIHDYVSLKNFHYLPGRPATFARIVAIDFISVRENSPIAQSRVAAVGVLSYPTLVHRARHRVFGLTHQTMKQKITWCNAHLRNISRVIVHPQFRSLGLAIELIRSLCDVCPTPFIESSARMGRVHPMFERAGFTRVDPEDDAHPVYYYRAL